VALSFKAADLEGNLAFDGGKEDKGLGSIDLLGRSRNREPAASSSITDGNTLATMSKELLRDLVVARGEEAAASAGGLKAGVDVADSVPCNPQSIPVCVCKCAVRRLGCSREDGSSVRHAKESREQNSKKAKQRHDVAVIPFIDFPARFQEGNCSVNLGDIQGATAVYIELLKNFSDLQNGTKHEVIQMTTGLTGGRSPQYAKKERPSPLQKQKPGSSAARNIYQVPFVLAISSGSALKGDSGKMAFFR
jgi:hypothetical protein